MTHSKKELHTFSPGGIVNNICVHKGTSTITNKAIQSCNGVWWWCSHVRCRTGAWQQIMARTPSLMTQHLTIFVVSSLARCVTCSSLENETHHCADSEVHGVCVCGLRRWPRCVGV